MHLNLQMFQTEFYRLLRRHTTIRLSAVQSLHLKASKISYCQTIAGRSGLRTHLPSTTTASRTSLSLLPYTIIRTMSDDASYMSFLNRANADPKAGQGSTMAESESTSQRQSNIDPTSASSSSALPASLKCLPEITYTSDTDSPFEPIVFNYSGSALPSSEEFKKVLSHAHKKTGEVEELSIQDFDPRGEYKDIIQRVEQAGRGNKKPKVFRVETSSTRAEYYILTVGDSMLIGVVAKAVES